MIAAFEIRKAMKVRWDPVLGDVDVVEDVPSNQKYPYVHLGERSTTKHGGKGEPGEDSIIDVHTWSRRGGLAEVEELQAAMFDALEGHTPALDGFTSISFERISSRAFMDADGITGHGVDRWRVCTEPA